MRNVLVSVLMLVIVASVPALALEEMAATQAVGRLFPDGVIDEQDWLQGEWRLIPHTAVANPEYAGVYTSDREAAMLLSVRYDSRFIYIAVKVVAQQLAMFPLSAVEFWLGGAHVIVARNYMDEPLFQWSVLAGDDLKTVTPSRSRMGMAKIDDVDPEGRYGLSGAPGYVVEAAIALQELEAQGVRVDLKQPLPFAAGYYRKLDMPGAGLRDGAIYLPASFRPYEPETFAQLRFVE